jgi:hypothetical protein
MSELIQENAAILALETRARALGVSIVIKLTPRWSWQIQLGPHTFSTIADAEAHLDTKAKPA